VLSIIPQELRRSYSGVLLREWIISKVKEILNIGHLSAITENNVFLVSTALSDSFVKQTSRAAVVYLHCRK